MTRAIGAFADTFTTPERRQLNAAVFGVVQKGRLPGNNQDQKVWPPAQAEEIGLLPQAPHCASASCCYAALSHALNPICQSALSALICAICGPASPGYGTAIMPGNSEIDDHRDAEPPAEPLESWLHRGVREVHRDEALWVLDKPAGILTHPNPPATQAANALLCGEYDPERELYRLRPPGGRARQVYLVHRLDLETSGLILCCFGAEAAAAVKEALYLREVEKEYRALLLGAPRPPEGEWSDRLEKRRRGGRVEVTALRGGRPNAVSGYRLTRLFPAGPALVSLSPRTGRTHQLRVQTAARGLPIAGDERYGDFRANRFLAEHIGLKRMFLHASRLELRHPGRGHRLKFTSELPRNLAEPLKLLEQLRERLPRRGRR
jgi:RluA family pseudouridine synthase